MASQPDFPRLGTKFPARSCWGDFPTQKVRRQKPKAGEGEQFPVRHGFAGGGFCAIPEQAPGAPAGGHTGPGAPPQSWDVRLAAYEKTSPPAAVWGGDECQAGETRVPEGKLAGVLGQVCGIGWWVVDFGSPLGWPKSETKC